MSSIHDPTRSWMQDLARLRIQADRLRQTPDGLHEESYALVERALLVTDTIRIRAAELQERCAELERTVAESQKQIGSLLELIPIAAVGTDPNGVITEANPAAADLLGRSVGKLRAQLLLHYAEDRDTLAELIKGPHQAEHPRQARLRIRPRERAPLEVIASVAPDLRDGGSSLLWIFTRITASRSVTSGS